MSKEKEKKSLDWIFRFKQHFGNIDSFGVRVLLGIAVTLILALFLHFRQVDVEVLELDTMAKKYYVAQTDFTFHDERATSMQKQEMLSGLGRVYQIIPQQIESERLDYEKKLQFDSNISQEQMQRLYEGLQKISYALVELRFTDRLSIEKMKESGIATQNFYPFTPGRDSAEKLPKNFYRYLWQKLHLDESDYSHLLPYYENMKWKFSVDSKTQDAVQDAIGSLVPQKESRVSAGSRIIDQGERITSRHVAMMQGMKKALLENRKLWTASTMLGSLLLALLFVTITVIYFRLKHPQLLDNTKRLLLYVVIILIALVIAKVTEMLLLGHKSHLIDVVRYPLFIPFAIILICFLMGVEIALFTTVLLTVIFAITLAVDESRFMVINLVASLICLFNTRFVRKRTEIFSICSRAWLSCIVVIFGFSFLDGVWWDVSVYHDLISTFLLMLFTAVICIGLLPLLESMFQIMTNITLMEFLDPNNPLLRRLNIEAPGTYQHSFSVGNLAESAAVSIGANGVFCRVASMYHDIGKLLNPQYFTENQQAGFNMHKLLTPQESAGVIIGHVKEGEKLARKYKLPKIFINIIREHHGTTLVYYFYHNEVKKMGGDPAKVDDKVFRYPGPKPKTKESAIIMIADSVEAASRSLEQINQQTVTDLVESLVHQKSENGQFDTCPLTFEELNQVKSVLIKNVLLMAGIRIKYPHSEGEEKPAAEDS